MSWPLPWSSVPWNFPSRIICDSLAHYASDAGCILCFDTLDGQLDALGHVADLNAAEGLDDLEQIGVQQLLVQQSEVSVDERVGLELCI